MSSWWRTSVVTVRFGETSFSLFEKTPSQRKKILSKEVSLPFRYFSAKSRDTSLSGSMTVLNFGGKPHRAQSGGGLMRVKCPQVAVEPRIGIYKTFTKHKNRHAYMPAKKLQIPGVERGYIGNNCFIFCGICREHF